MSGNETLPKTEEQPTITLTEGDLAIDQGPTEELPLHPHQDSSEIHLDPTLSESVNDVLARVPQHKKIEVRKNRIDTRAKAISEQIDADREQRGFATLQGLSFTLGNGHRYLVRESSVQQERRVEERKADLPQFISRRENRKAPFGQREKKETRSQKVAAFTKQWPFLNKDGILPNVSTGDKGAPLGERVSAVAIRRKVEGLRSETGADVKFAYRPVLLVEAYDEFGDLVDVKSMDITDRKRPKGQKKEDLQDIFKLAAEHGIVEADWEERKQKATDTEALSIDLPAHTNRDRLGAEKNAPTVFQAIAGQLEEKGITDWAGLEWKRKVPSVTGTPSAYTTQEIISDSVVKERTYDGYTWVRNFVVRTSTAADEGGISIHDAKMNDAEFQNYLETASVDLKIDEMQLVREKSESTPQKTQTEKDSELPYKVTLDDAFALLSYPEVYRIYRALDDDQSERNKMFKAEIEKRSNVKEQREYAQEILNTMHDVGFDKFSDVVGAMQEDFSTAVKQLRLKESVWDISDSWLISDLMKTRLQSDVDPFADTLEAQKLRRDMIDAQVGRRFSITNTKLGKPQPVPGDKLDDKGEPKIEMKRKYEFDDEWFGRHSVVDKPRIQAKERWDAIWGDVEKQAKKVFELSTAKPYDSKEKNPAIKDGKLAENERKLGRLLRRTIAK